MALKLTKRQVQIRCKKVGCKLIEYIDYHHVKFECVKCGKIVERRLYDIVNKKRIYCNSCSRSYTRKNINELGQFTKVPKIKCICLICNKEFETYPSYIKRGRKYCSKQCCDKGLKRPRYKVRVPKSKSICQYCGKTFKHNRYKKYNCCSISCASYLKQQIKPTPSGKDNYNWKGGRTSKVKILRNSPKFKKWRKAVFKRDKWICQECGSKGFLNAHHIIPIEEDINKIFDVNNGQTLCIECHQKKHPNLKLNLYQSYINHKRSKTNASNRPIR